MKRITRIVWILSLVSLFTDMASEMLYPVLPVYLRSIGFSVLIIGILEGIAEAAAGLSKGYFGNVSDKTGRRAIFVQTGYALSAVAKPLLALFVFPVWVFFVRTLERLGKGIRTGARDAILSDQAIAETRGAVFGFHRAMDTLGAVLGPLLALIYLYFYPMNYRTLFFLAFIPGLLAVFTSLLLKDKNPVSAVKQKLPSFFTFLKYWKRSPIRYRRLVTGLLMFALINSSDVFLLLKVKEAGFDDATMIGMYIFYNLVYAVFSFPLGLLADKIGLKTIFIAGLIIFAVVYAGMALSTSLFLFAGLFFLYGIYAAATEGISKAWISNIADKSDTATAIGNYTGFQSIATLLASSFTGLLWFQFGAAIALISIAVLTIVVITYFFVFILVRERG